MIDLALFSRYARSKDGLKPACKFCEKLRHAKYYENHSGEITEKVRKWQRENPVKVKEYKNKFDN